MRRRPQTNRRRGLLRAAAVVVLLLAVLVVAIVITSSSVKAPAPTPIPTAPIPPSTPPPLRVTPLPTAVKTSTKTPHTTASPGPTKKGALGAGDLPVTSLNVDGRHNFRQVASLLQAEQRSASPNPSGDAIAYFWGTGDAYSATPLFIRSLRQGVAFKVGVGDPLVRPIWSGNGKQLLYVRVRSTGGVPGARWTLVNVDIASKRETTVVSETAMNLQPLGWSQRRILFLTANSTDSTVFAAENGRITSLGIMVPQPVVSALLSPDGQFIAFGSPANCAYCSVNLYNVQKKSNAIGPIGMPNDSTFSWTQTGTTLIALIRNKLAAVRVPSSSVEYYPLPVGLPLRWVHPYLALASGNALKLRDAVSHVLYRTEK